ncbi:MAG TPA: ABC transporter permease [Bacillota bacterium]|nr:ABC transporter permease [Bacillota bacterium]
MSSLIWRIFKKGWVVQIALTLLLASAVALFAIYNAYIARESQVMVGRMKNTNPPGYFLVSEEAPRLNLPLSSGNGRMFTFVASWFEAVTPINLGDLPITYLDLNLGNLGFAPQANTAAVHENVARRLGLSEGDVLVLYPAGETLRVQVTDIYTDKPFRSEVHFGEGIVVRTGAAQLNSHFLYRQVPGITTREAIVRSALVGIHSRGSTLRAMHEDDPMAGQFVESSYNVIVQAKMTLLLFLAMAFLTAKLLAYMDNRRILAILKTLGLRRNQVAASISGESLIAPIVGSVLGGLAAAFVLRIISQSGFDMPFSTSSLVSSMLMIFPAVALGALVPARLAQVSTVNELLLERPAPLVRDYTTSASQRYPAMDGLMERGVRILKLETIQGHFDGFIFRRRGDRVQAGEVIALQHSWWGLKTKEYASPIDGVIVYFEEYTGMVGVAPQDMSQDEVARAAGHTT